jgi:hypothetical protein
MTTSMQYATWANVFGSLSPREDVDNFAAGFAADFDLDAIEDAYRAAVAALLPGSMLLVGDEFIADVDDPEIPEDWADALREQDLFTAADEMGQMFEENPSLT